MLLLIAFILIVVLGVVSWYANYCVDDKRYGCTWYNAEMCDGGYKCLRCKHADS